ncbi:DUF1688 family protein [Pannonibacter carbonis]|uniref:DUF1688 family protein n=1 Tax=Pannonibacter carbonis TaxID=2067569 RepID=UPI001FCA4B83|nr:DUF1688 family protein [Pannonibacter carbonis]
MPHPASASPALSLLAASAVRERANRLLELGLAGDLEHFTVDLSHLPALADRVIATTRRRYPDLAVPLQSCWRHFEAGGLDRWDMLAGARGFADVREMGRAAFDLAIVSCVTNAHPGTSWHYAEDVSGELFAGPAGLSIASLAMLASGLFSAVPEDPLRADAHALMRIEEAELVAGFQSGPGNRLEGLAGRMTLLNRLGEAIGLRPDLFAREDEPRPGGLFDILYDEGQQGAIPAVRILDLVLEGLGPVWPERTVLNGIGLGDTWGHSRLVTADATSGLMPLHMLSQWIAGSLIEPLAWAGVEVFELSALTGLADRDHCVLFLDSGILLPRDLAEAKQPHEPGSEYVTECRALTVALLDQLALSIRRELQATEDDLPLSCIVEGGTRAAGREIAREKRADGVGPVNILSDGTVF